MIPQEVEKMTDEQFIDYVKGLPHSPTFVEQEMLRRLEKLFKQSGAK